MKRTLILLLALAVLVAFTGPVGAKPDKPGKPGKPGTYEVTMNFVDGRGLATTCDGESITMTGNTNGGVLTAEGAVLEMALPLPDGWWRDYPKLPPDYESGPADPVGFFGCHGLAVIDPPSVDAFTGALWLDFGPNDKVTLTWRFDYYWQFGFKPNGRPVQEVVELFEMTVTPMDFDTGSLDPQLVNGDVTVALFTRSDEVSNQFVPMNEDPLPISFWLQIEPVE